MKLSPLPLLLLQSSLSQVNYSRATTTQLVTQLNLRLDDLPRAPAVVDALRDALGAALGAVDADDAATSSSDDDDDGDGDAPRTLECAWPEVTSLTYGEGTL